MTENMRMSRRHVRPLSFCHAVVGRRYGECISRTVALALCDLPRKTKTGPTAGTGRRSDLAALSSGVALSKL